MLEDVFRSHSNKLSKYTIDLIKVVWDELTYGFIKTSELVDDGYTPKTWAISRIPGLTGIMRGVPDQIHPVLCALLRYADRKRIGTMAIESKLDVYLLYQGGKIGIVNGEIVGGHASGTEVLFDYQRFLLSPLPDGIRVTNRFLLRILRLVDYLPEEKRQLGRLYMATLILAYSRQDDAAKALLNAAKFRTRLAVPQSRIGLPPEIEIENLLMGEQKTSPVLALFKKLVPTCMSRSEFIYHFGHPIKNGSRSEGRRYALLYAYRELQNGET